LVHGLEVVESQANGVAFNTPFNGLSGGVMHRPAIDVNSELGAIRKLPQGTITKAITSVGTVLTMPKGYKPIRVTSAAGTYVSLSTNAPVFDGFLWSITSGITAATVYDVEMRAV